MTYDIENMIPHTCHLGQEDVQLNDASALINVEDDMREFVDELADQDIPANQIWMFYAASKFYAASTCVVRGLSRSQVIKRIGNAKADTKMFSLVETPDLAKVKNEIVGFSQFNYAWHDDSRAKQGKSGIERLIGWSHPELRNLLRYDGLHLFVDGTFHCTPKSFHQFVTLMMYDPLTDLFVPVFFTLATNKTTDLYTKMFKCIEFALGKEPNPADVVCDFEAAMISAIDDRFPSTRIVGCLFHFKQACRRKMKEYRLSEAEAGVAMEFGVLDMLTVIHPQKIAVQGVAWVKTKIKERCAAKGLEYSRNMWKRFWQYFANTWLVTYSPELWNIYGVQRNIVNRTNNPLERFHRELNARMKAHPTLKRFVRVIEEIAREYVVLRRSIISGDATAPVRSNLRFPRSAVLPEPNDIVDSDDDNDDIDAENTGVAEDDDAQLSDDELGMLYDTSFDHEKAMESDAAA
ncbi:hypothetical protein PR003_g22901 [Phytophthora rubi]|uniref:MULE transposase domain-containing protein n=1 Tax=Phytophthora rubi TaxID=129364 RepID=A0A6A3IVV7_9STRA|nr:hypothetical protein PR001_g24503 [Phytophthora rubi]KAE8983553.1 hypothetical protein PR002_g23223 [Phytophthora rubi]KAE9299808.1 hypothetical protein PR003_g22901 [Phytophthora rubi]